MTTDLKGVKVALLVSNGFEQSELAEPKKALEAAGAKVYLISPVKDKVKGWKNKNWGDEFPVDVPLENANADNYHALLLPGGVMNPDQLRMNSDAVSFVNHFVSHDKPIAAICHGPWTLVDAQGLKEKTVTSWPSIKSDLKNAGANWVDEEVVVDGNLVTSRKPDDIPAFNKAMIKLFAETKH